jgi:hypothetical protein
MDKENNNEEMINQLENFINEFNELNNTGIFEKEPMFTETLEKIHNYENKQEKDTNSKEN